MVSDLLSPCSRHVDAASFDYDPREFHPPQLPSSSSLPHFDAEIEPTSFSSFSMVKSKGFNGPIRLESKRIEEEKKKENEINLNVKEDEYSLPFLKIKISKINIVSSFFGKILLLSFVKKLESLCKFSK